MVWLATGHMGADLSKTFSKKSLEIVLEADIIAPSTVSVCKLHVAKFLKYHQRTFAFEISQNIFSFYILAQILYGTCNSNSYVLNYYCLWAHLS